MRILKLSLLVLAMATSIVFGQSAASLSESDYMRIDPDPSRGFLYPYFLYVPPRVKADKRSTHTIIVAPVNTGQPDDNLAIHEADARKRVAGSGQIASILNVAVLAPVFPRPRENWQIYTHALDRDTMLTDKKEYRRLDLQMVAMIDDALRRLADEGLRFDKRVLINGFSAQGMFANRFTFLHPRRVKAAAIGSPGGWPIAPVVKYQNKMLRYPIGIGDFKSVTGNDVDMKALKKVPLFIFIGDKDVNDSVPFGDSYDDVDRELINPLFGKTPVERWPISEKLYKQAGLNVEFKLYPDVPHLVSPLMRDDIRAFFLRQLK